MQSLKAWSLNMELKYVGDFPLISKHGVSFDHSQPDRYIYLQATVSLLEALSYGPSETTEHLYKTKGRKLSAHALLEKLKKYVKTIENAFIVRDKKAHDYVHDLVNRAKTNSSLLPDDRVALLENIKLMRAYFYQYITNEAIYDEAIKAIGDEIHYGKIKKIKVPLFKHYEVVLVKLMETLERRKQPIDSEMTVEDKDGKFVVILNITHY